MTLDKAITCFRKLNPDSDILWEQKVIAELIRQAIILTGYWNYAKRGWRDDVAGTESPTPAVKCKYLTQEQADQLDRIEAGVTRLVQDREGRRAANAERGRASYATGDGNAERKRAAADMERATERVRERVLACERKGRRAYVINECRDVCGDFTPRSTRKDALGKCADGYCPLTGADGSPIQPETLARRYRERYGTEREVLPVGW